MDSEFHPDIRQPILLCIPPIIQQSYHIQYYSITSSYYRKRLLLQPDLCPDQQVAHLHHHPHGLIQRSWCRSIHDSCSSTTMSQNLPQLWLQRVSLTKFYILSHNTMLSSKLALPPIPVVHTSYLYRVNYPYQYHSHYWQWRHSDVLIYTSHDSDDIRCRHIHAKPPYTARIPNVGMTKISVNTFTPTYPLHPEWGIAYSLLPSLVHD